MYTLYEEQQGKRHQTLVPLDDCVHQRRRYLALLSRIYKYVELNKPKLHRYLLTHSQVLLPTKQMADKACVLETLKELLPPLRQSSQLKREQPKTMIGLFKECTVLEFMNLCLYVSVGTQAT